MVKIELVDFGNFASYSLGVELVGERCFEIDQNGFKNWVWVGSGLELSYCIKNVEKECYFPFFWLKVNIW